MSLLAWVNRHAVAVMFPLFLGGVACYALFLKHPPAPAIPVANPIVTCLGSGGVWTEDGCQQATMIARDFAPRQDGDARLPDCDTVETDWGACVAAGTYEGDPVLLFGHAPLLHTSVTINAHGQGVRRVPCPPDAGVSMCIDRLPLGSVTIIVATPEDAHNVRKVRP